MPRDSFLRLLAAAVFAGVYSLVLLPIARFYWFVPAGWRFAALALLPWRYWPWVVGGELYSRIWYEVGTDPPPGPMLEFFFSVPGWVFLFAGPSGGVLGSLLLRLRVRDVGAALERVSGMGWLIAACLVGALGETAGNLLSVHLNHDPLALGYWNFVAGKFTGDYIGVIALAPALFALAFARRPKVWRADALILAACLLSYIGLIRIDLDAPLYGYLRLLVLAGTFVWAQRHGWRGAALALSLSSFVVAMAPSAHPLVAYHDMFTQFLLALLGSATLLLGAAMDAQRQSHEELAARSRELEHASAALRDAAQRNLRLEEEQRRRIAAEIHDELGQNLTAVHTRVKLAAERLNAAQLGDVTTSIYDILATMRGSVRGLMDSLRPPVLDEFGLMRALREGPLRDLVEHAGLHYEFDLRGDPALIAALDDATQIAVWRIVQEAATNTVRHARATRFRACLRVGVRETCALAILDLRDDGVGLPSAADHTQGFGLQGMRDRVLALSGAMRTTSNAHGTRLHVLLRQAV